MNITKELFHIYKKYDGDSDWVARIGSAEEKKVMVGAGVVWLEITDLCQQITLSKRGLLSESMEESLKRRLNEQVSDKEIIQEIVDYCE